MIYPIMLLHPLIVSKSLYNSSWCNSDVMRFQGHKLISQEFLAVV